MVKVEVGQKVIVGNARYLRRARPYGATVTKVARVWVTVQRDERSLPERFRLDDQTDGRDVGAWTRFYTLEQWTAELRRGSALQFLSEQGVRLDYASPWCGREAELAGLLGWEYVEQPATERP